MNHISFQYGIENDKHTKKLRNRVFNNLDKILPVTFEARKYVESCEVDADKIEVIHPGIDAEDFAPGKKIQCWLKN